MEIFDFRKDDIQSILTKTTKPFTGPRSGINALDESIIGFDKGEVIVIGGRTSMGKSSLARTIMLNIADPVKKWGKCVLISMEMPKDDLVGLITASYAQVNHHHIKKGVASTVDMDKYKNAGKVLTDFNMELAITASLTPNMLRAYIDSLIKQEQVACIIVDYFQLMTSDERGSNRQAELQNVSREIKCIAMEYKIPIILLAQLNRNPDYRESARPRLVDLRDTGAAENDSDKVLLLFRQDYYNKQYNPKADESGDAEILIPKCRGGKTGVVECAFIGEWTLFLDKPEEF